MRAGYVAHEQTYRRARPTPTAITAIRKPNQGSSIVLISMRPRSDLPRTINSIAGLLAADGRRRSGRGEHGNNSRCYLEFLLFALALLPAVASAAEPLDVKIGYLRRPQHQETISLLRMPPPDDGLAGAEMAVKDNDTTGRFLNQRFSLVDTHLTSDADVVAAIGQLADKGVSLVVADLPADALLKAADAGKAHGMLFFNAGSAADRLRQEDCRANVIYTAPSRAMLADGLAQYLVWKKWTRWLLVVGSHQRDKLFAAALKRAATRFGAKIVQEREFKDTGGARRTDSGVVQIQRQIPVFTQEAPAYDVLVAADESEVFASYLPYRTWDARPVAGSAGLCADQLGCVERPLGRHPNAKPVQCAFQAADDGSGHAGLDGRAHDRRRRSPQELNR